MTLKNKVLKGLEQQPFHLANPSPWPMYTSLFTFKFLLSILLFFHNYSYAVSYIYFSLFFLLYVICNWFYNIVIESTFQGNHTKKVQFGLKMGMILFICSEIMFFFSFFWCFFHISLAPSIWIGSIWPPAGLKYISFLDIPLLNTVILLSSGISLTWSHRIFLNKKLIDAFNGLFITILWGLFFTYVQSWEYNSTTFTINDSVYGSIFFTLTGFHGFHVILGFSLLIVCLIRLLFKHFTAKQHVGFECSIWYWHFVDIVWLFLYFIVYCWGC